MDAAKILKIDALTRLPSRYREFQEFLAGVLEGERELVQPAASSSEVPAFQLRDDVESLLDARSSQTAAAKRTEAVFSQLAPFFEAGVLFKRADDGSPRVEAMFLFGRCYASSSSEPHVIPEVRLPAFAADRVMKGRIKPFLRALQFESLGTLSDASVFALTPRRDTVIALVCGRPHPWQIGVVEKTYHVVSELLRAGSRR